MSSETNFRPATSGDLSRLAHISKVFSFDPLYVWIHPKRLDYPQDYLAWKYKLLCFEFYGLEAELMVLELKSSEETEPPGWPKDTEEKNIRGYVIIKNVYDDDNVEDMKKLDKLRSKRSWGHWFLRVWYGILLGLEEYFGTCRSMDGKAMRQFLKKSSDTNLLPPDIGPHFLLADLAVVRIFQHSGYGSHLLKLCQDMADDRNMSIALEASPKIRGFYEKHGFRQPFGSYSYVVWNEDPLVEGVSLIYNGIDQSSPDPDKYQVSDDRTRAFLPDFSPQVGEQSSIDANIEGDAGGDGLRKRKGKWEKEQKEEKEEKEKEKGGIVQETISSARSSGKLDPAANVPPGDESLSFDDYPRSPDGAAGLRSRRGKKGDLEAKVDEHGRTLPKAIDSPISATGLPGDSEDEHEVHEEPRGFSTPLTSQRASAINPYGSNESKRHNERRQPIPDDWRTEYEKYEGGNGGHGGNLPPTPPPRKYEYYDPKYRVAPPSTKIPPTTTPSHIPLPITPKGKDTVIDAPEITTPPHIVAKPFESERET